MHLYSPKAYNFLREKFNCNLPNESTIRKWYANCSSNGEPGIQRECLEVLARLVTEFKNMNKTLYCSLSFDEMATKQNVKWSDSKKRFLGHTTYGSESRVIANQAIVFMLSGINSPFSMPIAYHFISSLNKSSKAKLLKEIIRAVSTFGIKITSITFDGLITNFSTCKELGASFELIDFRPYFVNEVDNNNTKIHIFLDPCHMLKLWRNTLGKHKTIVDGKGQQIKWIYFERLETYRVKNQFVTHNINKKHIQWDKDKMNVLLAVQTLSNSVSKSLEFLMGNNINGFKNCAGTIEFTKKANDLFDVFNVNVPKSNNEHQFQNNENSFKNLMLDKNNKTRIFDFLDEISRYIKSLKVLGKAITSSRNKTGFVGFLINIESLKNLYDEYVETDLLDQIPTFRLSQDHLESFFGRCRALCGSNNNPTEEEFLSAFRKLLVDSEISSSPFSNCRDDLSILSVSSRKDQSSVEVCSTDDNVDAFSRIHQITTQDYLLDAFQYSTIAYIAAEIEAKILNTAYFHCIACKEVFKENEQSSSRYDFPQSIHHTPCKTTVDICVTANKFIKVFQNDVKMRYLLLVNTILQNVNFDYIYLNSIEHESGHMYYLVRFIIEEFIRRKFNYIAKNETLENQKKFLRNKFKNIIKELGQ